jgi:hypothetical protein
LEPAARIVPSLPCVSVVTWVPPALADPAALELLRPRE